MNDLLNERFGRLTVIARAGKNAAGSRWKVLCDCGNEREVQRSALTSGAQVSCGCKKKEVLYENRPLKHGMSNTSTYKIWLGMRKRCMDERDSRYGGRGIKVCERWLESFDNFLADMGERPEGMSIERNNNDSDYEAKNCRWATVKEQARNKRNNIVIEFDGRKMILQDWATYLGMDRRTLAWRLKAGWSLKKTLTKGIDNE